MTTSSPSAGSRADLHERDGPPSFARDGMMPSANDGYWVYDSELRAVVLRGVGGEEKVGLWCSVRRFFGVSDLGFLFCLFVFWVGGW